MTSSHVHREASSGADDNRSYLPEKIRTTRVDECKLRTLRRRPSFACPRPLLAGADFVLEDPQCGLSVYDFVQWDALHASERSNVMYFSMMGNAWRAIQQFTHSPLVRLGPHPTPIPIGAQSTLPPEFLRARPRDRRLAPE